ncbi:MAG: M14 family zinc carboxypeptidase [bacterium]
MTMRRAPLLLLGVLGIFLFTLTALGADQIAQVRVKIEKKSDYLTLQTLHLDQTYRGKDFIDIMQPVSKLKVLDEAGLSYEVVHEDVTAFYRSRLDSDAAKAGSMGGYRTLAEIELFMDSISTEYPSIVTPKWSIGQTVEGRSIWVFKVSDNPLIDEDETEMWYYSATHSREVITPEVLAYFLRYLTNNYGSDPEVTYLVDNREMFFSLSMNPDGYYRNQVTDPNGGGMWRKNRRNNGDGTYGVDLNRNYAYQWGYDDEGSSPYTDDETYRGTAAFSEPETQAYRDFVNSRNFKVIVDYHSYSNLILWPWGYDYFYTPDQDIFEQIGDSASAWNGYEPTPVFGLYLTNGVSVDWHYGATLMHEKIYAISEEVGGSSDGFWPSTSRITPLVSENLEPNLFYARIAGNPEQLRAPAVPMIYPVGTVGSSSFELAWHHQDSQNPAVGFDVWQFQGLERITDDLEGAISNWTTDGFVSSTARSHSASHSYFGGDNSGADYKVTAKQTLQVDADDTLSFWTWYNIETDWDYAYVEVSTDGLSWDHLAGTITTNYNPHSNNLGNGITGNSGGWVHAFFDLTAYAGQSVSLRFRYRTDSYVEEEGFYVDDIYPLDVFGDATLLADQEADTSLLVTDLVDGDYYYQVFATDAEGQQSAGSTMEQVTVQLGAPCDWLVGDANGDGTVNITDAVSLILYIFSGGVAPTPHAVGSGDADCNGIANVADAVQIVAFIFGGGVAPGQDCTCEDYP